MSRWSWWVSLWDRREDPTSLALVRIFLATVLLWDLGRIGNLGLVEPFFAGEGSGGLGAPLTNHPTPWLYAWLGDGVDVAWGLYGTLVAAAVLLWVGVVPRLAAFVLMAGLAQFALAVPAADRGIDQLVRNVLTVLVFADSGATLSLSSRWRWGHVVAPSEARVQAWPRLLLSFQVVVVYFAAGVSKVASSWTPFGGLSALYVAMSDPHFQRWPDEWVYAIWPLTRIGTLVTWVWEWCAPVVLLAWWYRETPTRGGRLRHWMNARPIPEMYLLLGAVFHLGTHLTLHLGIFPFAMMSVYPACVHPDTLRLWGARLRGRLRPSTTP